MLLGRGAPLAAAAFPPGFVTATLLLLMPPLPLAGLETSLPLAGTVSPNTALARGGSWAGRCTDGSAQAEASAELESPLLTEAAASALHSDCEEAAAVAAAAASAGAGDEEAEDAVAEATVTVALGGSVAMATAGRGGGERYRDRQVPLGNT